MTECCCYCCTAVKSTTVVRIPERCVLSVLLLVSRPEPAPADCSLATEGRAARASGAKQRRYAAVSPSNLSIVLLLFAVVDNILNLESMLCFELKNLMTQVVGFWARIRRLGLWDSQIEKKSGRILHIWTALLSGPFIFEIEKCKFEARNRTA